MCRMSAISCIYIYIYIYNIHNNTEQRKQFRPIAKNVLTVFVYFWDADSKSVFILVVEGKVSELCIHIYIIYAYNELKNN